MTAKQIAQKDSLALKAYIDSIPFSEYAEVKKKIIEGCLIKAHTLSNWQYGLCRIPNLHKAKIEEIIGRKIFS